MVSPRPGIIGNEIVAVLGRLRKVQAKDDEKPNEEEPQNEEISVSAIFARVRSQKKNCE